MTEVWQVQNYLNCDFSVDLVAQTFSLTPQQVEACRAYPTQSVPDYLEELDGI